MVNYGKFRGEKMDVRKVSSLIIYIYLILKPFYLWGSGLPQLSDIVLSIVIILTVGILIIYKKIHNIKIVVISIVLLGYIIFVNLIWYLILYYNTSLLFNNLFYIFNILIMLSIIYLYKDKTNYFLKVVFYGICSSILLQVFLYVISNENQIRETLYFNNPNQLAYYSLLCLGILLIIYEQIKINKILFYSSLISIFLLIIVSSSQAALFSAIIVYFLYVYISKKDKIDLIIHSFLIVLSFVFVFIIIKGNNILDIKPLETLIWRFEKSSINNSSFISERGYERILMHPEYWLFGAGEGVYSRFNDPVNYEIHSTLGTLFFSYGIIGTLIFGTLLYLIIKYNKFKTYYPLIGIVIYGLSHNGLRNSLLWMLLAMLIMCMEFNKNHDDTEVLKI